MRAGSWVNCRVGDKGSDVGRIKPGRGLRILSDLALSMGGRIDRSRGPVWNSFSLDFPLTQREQRANRTVAGRRPKADRRLKPLPRPLRLPLASERVEAIAVRPEPTHVESRATFRTA